MNIIEPTAIYTSSDLAKLLVVQDRVLWSLLGSGDLCGRKIGRVWRISGESLLAYVNQPDTAPKAQSSHNITQTKAQAVKKPIAPRSSLSDSEDAPNKQRQNVPSDTSQKRQSSGSKEARDKAIRDAYKACEGNARTMAEWLNKGINDGTQQAPARGSSWTTGGTRKAVSRLGLREKTAR